MLIIEISQVYNQEKLGGKNIEKQNTELVKNVITYMYLAVKRADLNDLKVLSNYLFDYKYDLTFDNNDLLAFNRLISSNKSDEVVKLFEEKKELFLNKKETLQSIDDLWQYIMNQAYEKWDDSLTYTEFLEKLNSYERIAVQFGKFNQQIENNGLYGWDDNGYSGDYDALHYFIEQSNFNKKTEFLNILETFDYVQEKIKKLDRFDDFYESDCNTRYKYLEGSEEEYEFLKDDWINYFQNYLFTNMPNEYLQKIIENNKNINI